MEEKYSQGKKTEMVPPPRQSSNPASLFKMRPMMVVRALESFDNHIRDGLSFQQGDIFHVVDYRDSNWYEVVNPQKKIRGLVPIDCFEELDDKQQHSAPVYETNPNISYRGTNATSANSALERTLKYKHVERKHEDRSATRRNNTLERDKNYKNESYQRSTEKYGNLAQENYSNYSDSLPRSLARRNVDSGSGSMNRRNQDSYGRPNRSPQSPISPNVRSPRVENYRKEPSGNEPKSPSKFKAEFDFNEVYASMDRRKIPRKDSIPYQSQKFEAELNDGSSSNDNRRKFEDIFDAIDASSKSKVRPKLSINVDRFSYDKRKDVLKTPDSPSESLPSPDTVKARNDFEDDINQRFSSDTEFALSLGRKRQINTEKVYRPDPNIQSVNERYMGPSLPKDEKKGGELASSFEKLDELIKSTQWNDFEDELDKIPDPTNLKKIDRYNFMDEDSDSYMPPAPFENHDSSKIGNGKTWLDSEDESGTLDRGNYYDHYDEELEVDAKLQINTNTPRQQFSPEASPRRSHVTFGGFEDYDNDDYEENKRSSFSVLFPSIIQTLEGPKQYDLFEIASIHIPRHNLIANKWQYQIVITLQDDRKYLLYRTYNDFWALMVSMITHYPNEAGYEQSQRLIPFLPKASELTEPEVKKRREYLEAYLDCLLDLPSHILENTVLDKFFQPNLDDILDYEEDKDENDASDVLLGMISGLDNSKGRQVKLTMEFRKKRREFFIKGETTYDELLNLVNANFRMVEDIFFEDEAGIKVLLYGDYDMMLLFRLDEVVLYLQE